MEWLSIDVRLEDEEAAKGDDVKALGELRAFDIKRTTRVGLR